MKSFAGTAIAVLSACVAASAAAQETEVTVLRVQPGDQEEAYHQELAAAYEETHPDVEVTFEYIANEA